MKTKYKVIEESFNKEKYIILYPTLDEYNSFKTKRDKIIYRCSQGHEHSITWYNWKSGRRCFHCFNKSISTPFKEVVNTFKVRGYEVLLKEDEYISAHRHNIPYKCPNGHEHSIRYMDFKRGHGCPYCVGLNKNNISMVRKSFEDNGYQLLTDKYINNKQYLQYICPKGHQHKIRWDDWQKGTRCGFCDNKYITIDQVRQSFEDKGYQLLSTKYVDCNDKLSFICPEGHKHNITWNSWNNLSQRCGKCRGLYKDIEDIRRSFESEGYQLLTDEYISSNDQKLKFICPNGHRHYITWDKWYQGQRCGKCNHSRPENQLLNYVKFTHPHLNIVHQDRNQIFNPKTGRGLEFDIWFPELNKAIEMDGVKVHSFKGRPEMDILKNRLCEEKGIPLLRITDEEWYTSDDVRTKIHKFIGL